MADPSGPGPVIRGSRWAPPAVQPVTGAQGGVRALSRSRHWGPQKEEAEGPLPRFASPKKKKRRKQRTFHLRVRAMGRAKDDGGAAGLVGTAGGVACPITAPSGRRIRRGSGQPPREKARRAPVQQRWARGGNPTDGRRWIRKGTAESRPVLMPPPAAADGKEQKAEPQSPNGPKRLSVLHLEHSPILTSAISSLLMQFM
ncbi:hypothetical protein SKAU_G00314610 [Synaphobranchus kaupii]|uniref:Uncharacterized protein n=1 Tax=Synaphobranchus kaupii TaxID=118154 RepID=A0A9Q1ESG1_SYNKA|nr:hypothetical protein SKAU_G00314610 [Synaphobranchus kaupii]